MPGWVYILQSLRDERFYIGSTVNLERRLTRHHQGFTPSTKRFGELKLVFRQEFPTIHVARTIEAKLKALKRRDYIQKIVQDGVIKMGA